MSEDRHSQAEVVELIEDPHERAIREAENGIRQYNAALEMIKSNIPNTDNAFKLKSAAILELHREALDGVHLLAGTYRNTPVLIGDSDHVPPSSSEVPDLVYEMCNYVNSNWEDMVATHLAAYVLWRMNWIHPFADGNGRTARMVSYVVLNIKLDSVLPGAPTIPEQIASNKQPYYDALEKADASWKGNSLGIMDMEVMLDGMLAKQLLSASQEASL